jgi:hypothetical protein
MMTRLMMIALLFSAVAACSESVVDDEFATEDTSEVSDAKADAAGTYTYYEVKRDLRRCASPFCAGYWVTRVNRTTTRCGDGQYAASCYVAEIRWSGLGLSDESVDKVRATIGEGSVVLRGTVGLKSFGAQIGSLGEFRPSEAWLGQGPNLPTGPFAKLSETGVRCISAPCPAFREKKLNGSAEASIAELGWDSAAVSDDVVGRAITELFVRDVIIAGERYTVTGPGGSAKARTVTQFYTRARDHKACFVGGCSGQLCTDHEGAISTCQYHAEYACYHTATCEEQVEGECGWTETEELNACLANPPQS